MTGTTANHITAAAKAYSSYVLWWNFPPNRQFLFAGIFNRWRLVTILRFFHLRLVDVDDDDVLELAEANILEEARRREDFPAVEFRDTRLGRVAFVQGTRVQVGFVYGQTLGDSAVNAEKLAESFAWPRWKAAGVLVYLQEFAEECRQEWEDLSSSEVHALKRVLPDMEHREFASL